MTAAAAATDGSAIASNESHRAMACNLRRLAGRDGETENILDGPFEHPSGQLSRSKYDDVIDIPWRVEHPTHVVNVDRAPKVIEGTAPSSDLFRFPDERFRKGSCGPRPNVQEKMIICLITVEIAWT